MARFIVDIPDRLAKKAIVLLDAAKYGSLSDLVAVALENQFALEDGSSRLEGGFLREAAVSAAAPSGISSLSRLSLKQLPKYGQCAQAPDASRLLRPGETSEESLYLWGQINRLFPVKLGLRVLLSLSEGESRVSLDNLRDRASVMAREVGLEIRAQQDNHNVKRAVAAWVGLPVGEQAEKSLARYRSHFLGYARRDGVLEGAVFRLKFAALTDDSRDVQLTDAGLAWATAENPILDRGDLSALPLSETESSLYAEHVLEAVPEERRPLAEALSFVRSGAEAPSQIDEALAAIHPDWSENIVLTMRAGALGRLWELGMLTKRGGHGSTSLACTPNGLRFLQAAEQRGARL